MTHDEMEDYRKQLVKILSKKDEQGKFKPEVLHELQKLIVEVGASYAGIPEMIFNIHQALQTASMINMCETATRGYKIAEATVKKATRAWAIAAITSLCSMIAAWVAVFWNWGATR
jgi:hypothetical protein